MTQTGRAVPVRPVAVRATVVPVWGWYLCWGGAMISAYFLLPLLHAPHTIQVLAYAAVSLSAAGAVLLGVRRHQPVHRTPWYLLAVGQFAYALGDITFYVDRTTLGIDRYPFIDDACYLVSYPLMAAGLLLFVRRRTPGWDIPSAIDATIVALGAGLVMWVYVMAPQLADSQQSPLGKVVSIAYPAMDLMLAVVAFRVAIGRVRPTVSHGMLYGWVTLVFGSDVAYGYLDLAGTYRPGNVLDLLWLSAAVLLGAAALHPGMRAVDEPVPVPDPTAGAGRLVALAVTCTAAPALLLVQYLRHAPLHVPVFSAVCTVMFLLSLARMKGVVEVQRRAAITDPLTGLRTRRFLREAMLSQVGPDTGLLLLDLDHFKQINDSYGHAAGDAVLCEVAERLRLAVRRGDVVARYGGEEFAILLPRTDIAEIANLGERIRQGVADAPIRAGEHLVMVTISVGAASLRRGQGPDDLIADADSALYVAKQAGRNRVVAPAAAGKSAVIITAGADAR